MTTCIPPRCFLLWRSPCLLSNAPSYYICCYSASAVPIWNTTLDARNFDRLAARRKAGESFSLVKAEYP